jgi:hypothetical protein
VDGSVLNKTEPRVQVPIQILLWLWQYPAPLPCPTLRAKPQRCVIRWNEGLIQVIPMLNGGTNVPASQRSVRNYGRYACRPELCQEKMALDHAES